MEGGKTFKERYLNSAFKAHAEKCPETHHETFINYSKPYHNIIPFY